VQALLHDAVAFEHQPAGERDGNAEFLADLLERVIAKAVHFERPACALGQGCEGRDRDGERLPIGCDGLRRRRGVDKGKESLLANSTMRPSLRLQSMARLRAMRAR
jgi:hypothetical protein